MRNLLIVCALLAVAMPLRGQEPGGGGVGALGQAVKRPPAPTGPVPRLPDGTVDLNGVWVGGGPVNDLESQGGLKKGDDPGAYSKPFTVTFNARLSNPGDEMMEYICQENNQYGIAGGAVPEK